MYVVLLTRFLFGEPAFYPNSPKPVEVDRPEVFTSFPDPAAEHGSEQTHGSNLSIRERGVHDQILMMVLEVKAVRANTP